MSADYPPVRLWRRPLVWRILGRRGWYRAVPFFAMAEFAEVGQHRNREHLAGIDPWVTPWLPGDTVERAS